MASLEYPYSTDAVIEPDSCDRIFPGPESGVTTFSILDYVVFSVVLGISVAIGFYHAFAGGGQRTTSEFLFADRSMSALPVALSVFASFFSASTILGTPAEIYQQGTMYWMCVWGAIFAPLVGAFIFGPFFHRMKMLSVYEVGAYPERGKAGPGLGRYRERVVTINQITV